MGWNKTKDWGAEVLTSVDLDTFLSGNDDELSLGAVTFVIDGGGADIEDNIQVLIPYFPFKMEIQASAIYNDDEGVIGASLTWKGAWVTATAYVVDDVVKHLGDRYVCTSDHTSASDDEPSVGSGWEGKWTINPQCPNIELDVYVYDPGTGLDSDTDSICASALPFLDGDQSVFYKRDTTLTGWSKTVLQGKAMAVQVISSQGISKAYLTLNWTRAS